MDTLQQELQNIDMTLAHQPPHTRRSVRHHLKRLIERYGEHQSGPYQLNDFTTRTPSIVSTHNTAVACLMDALRNDLDLRHTPKAYTVTPHPVLAKRHAAQHNLDQTLDHDVTGGPPDEAT